MDILSKMDLLSRILVYKMDSVSIMGMDYSVSAMDMDIARKKFEAVKQTFFNQGQPGQVLVVAAEFEDWLVPHMDGRGVVVKGAINRFQVWYPCPEGYFWYKKTYRWLPVNIHAPETMFFENKAARVACAVFLENTPQDLLLFGDAYSAALDVCCPGGMDGCSCSSK